MIPDLPPPPQEAPAEQPTPAAPRRQLRWLIWLPVCFVLGMAVSYAAFALPLRTQVADLRGQVDAAQSAQAQVEVPEDVKRYDVPIDNDPIYGPDDAPITIIEFSDYECPYCKKWHNETWPLIQQNYGDKVRLVYRDFPLVGLHTNALAAAEAADCAGDQGKYWEFNNTLFSQDENLSRNVYESTASSLGLDMAVFQKCLDDRPHQDEVEADYNYATQLGVSSTPTFFINGLALIGAQPYEVFAQVIEMELNGEIPK
jgi:protein-disulfide isomerase